MWKTLVNDTPVEMYEGVAVKREDLCSPLPGPMFSKIRGVLKHIESRPEQTIAVLDTYHSKAGWAVSYCCKILGKKCLNFYPVYKADGELNNHHIRDQQLKSEGLGSRLLPLPAGRSAILYHQAKRITTHMGKQEEYAGGTYLMPNALKLPETFSETAEEVLRTDTSPYHTIVISVSSGTIAAGILRGLVLKMEMWHHIILHMGYSRSAEELLHYVETNSGFPRSQITVVNEGYAYKDKARNPIQPDFPCNPYYDLKAWSWLMRHRSGLIRADHLLFWNIGA
jgi:hypothetical protein